MHAFEQDPKERLVMCVECGMWPKHHNHQPPPGRFIGPGERFQQLKEILAVGECVCADCMATSFHLPFDRMGFTADDYDDLDEFGRELEG
jgi:hypothetical protein